MATRDDALRFTRIQKVGPDVGVRNLLAALSAEMFTIS
jgi:hypothetical protein